MCVLTAAFLYMNDLYGEAFESELTSSCSGKGVTLQSFGFTSMDEASIDSAVALLDEAAIGVVGVLSIGATDLRHITEAALTLGMLGHGTRACWWFADSQLSAFQALPQAAQQALHGSHYLNGYGGGTDASPSFSSFVDNWPNRRPNDYNDMLPAGWKLPADFFLPRAPPLAPCASLDPSSTTLSQLSGFWLARSRRPARCPKTLGRWCGRPRRSSRLRGCPARCGSMPSGTAGLEVR